MASAETVTASRTSAELKRVLLTLEVNMSKKGRGAVRQ